MKSADYWHKAALRREIAIQEGATATAKDILRLYDAALDDINDEIRKIKYNFQKRFGLDNETAAMYLTQAQREENLASLTYALENAPGEAERKEILKYIRRDGLSVRAYASRIERYDAVKQSIFARIKRLAIDETALISDMMKKAYSASYYSVMDDTAKGLDVGINFGILNDRAISEAVNAKWHGSRFSERIWKHTDELAAKAQELVTKAIMSGESLAKTGQKLQTEFGVEKYRAMTLVRTETAHAHAMAEMKAYEDLGIEEYKWLSTLDYATCEICQPLDGQVFKLSEAKEGATIPPLHPNCRCTTTINMDYTSRRARNPLTGKNEIVDGDMTYEQWVKNMTPEQKQALETTRLKESRKVADKEQYARYRKTLGTKEVGHSFNAFQEMKYGEPEKWADLKELYRQNVVDKSGGSGIIRNRTFNSQNDPMLEAMGSAEYSHPKEIEEFKREIISSGAQIVIPEREKLAYAPGLMKGEPGTVFVSKGASYSAWCHEIQHFRDDRDAGWSGMRILCDIDERIRREERGYAVEIKLARSLGREDMVKRLQDNLTKERMAIYGTS